MKITELIKDKPILMGVLNVTPDSFSDGGLYLEAESAVNKVDELVSDGAHIVDIGGVSTGPGSSMVSVEEEVSRLSRILQLCGRGQSPAPTKIMRRPTLFSVDTYRANVASHALNAGSNIINDISALRFSGSEMAKQIVEHSAYIVLMYSKEDGKNPHVSNKEAPTGDIVSHICKFLEDRINFALKNGIKKEQIIIDPGMGRYLSSDPAVSWEVLERLEEIKKEFSEFAMLVGTSRKSFLGGEVDERDEVSWKTSMDAFRKGADILRMHRLRRM